MSSSPWLDSAISQIGKLHDGPDVVRLAREIAEKIPDQADYWKDVTPTTPWCGVFAAWNLVRSGIALPGPRDGVGAMFVNWWLDYGTAIPIGQEQPGDLALWLGTPPPHHISIVAGNGQYVGGNQSDGVTRGHYRTPDAIRRPPVAGAIAADPHPEIKIGATGGPVIELQRLLGVDQDGEFGPDTDAAVRAFQASHILDVDGEVGANTWAALLGGPAPTPQPTNGMTSKGSWYSQYDGKYHWHDGGDKAGSNDLHVPDDAQGIARPQKFGTIGTWWMIRAPNGHMSLEIQSDHGPGVSTGRTVDISAAAAERLGYSPSNFPTDSIFTFWPVDPPKEVAGLSKQQQAVRYRDLRKDIHMTDPTTDQPTPVPAPQPTLPAIQLPHLNVLQGLQYIVEGNRDKVRADLKLFLDVFNSKHSDIPIGLPTLPAAPGPTATPLHQTAAFQLGGLGLAFTGILHTLGMLDPNMAILGAIVSAGTAFLGPAGGIVGTILMNLARAGWTYSQNQQAPK